MQIIINNSSMKPIYEQIESQIKAEILAGKLLEDTALPSVRTLAKDVKVSALTVKKAYDTLEQEGLVVTVPGKGSFVAHAGINLREEQFRKEVESDMEAVIRKGKSCGMSREDLKELIDIIMMDTP
ncbi:MAG: GntR family transcriptional regulator [Lachnospira sp.]|nr:GntR family transcriptional regulator [Lachnospira sp.]